LIFCEHKNLYGHEADVPEDSYTVPFGEAEVVRDGKDVTIVSYGLTVHRALEKLSANNISAEVIDLRTLSPIDWDTVIESVESTVASSSLMKRTHAAPAIVFSSTRRCCSDVSCAMGCSSLDDPTRRYAPGLFR
jgi:pyruvate/2-oxoglutarate/acetoin dehydrogenase E1 component